jgi:hypothetical protein
LPTQTGPASTTPATHTLALTASQIRIVDPKGGDRTEFNGYQNIVDGNPASGWTTDEYTSADWGQVKSGMGILINLGTATKVNAVRVLTATGGASVSLRTGASDPGNTTDGDTQIDKTYTQIGTTIDDGGTTMVFAVPDSQPAVQYLLVWISKLPQPSAGKFQITVNEVEVIVS